MTREWFEEPARISYQHDNQLVIYDRLRVPPYVRPEATPSRVELARNRERIRRVFRKEVETPPKPARGHEQARQRPRDWPEWLPTPRKVPR